MIVKKMCTRCFEEKPLLSLTRISMLNHVAAIDDVCDRCMKTYKYPQHGNWIGIKLADEDDE